MKLSVTANLKFLTILILLLPAIKLKAQWNSPYDDKGNTKPISEWEAKKQPAVKKQQERTKTYPESTQTSTTNSSINSTADQSSVFSKKEVFYYETISNSAKTTDFIIWIYPYTYSFDATLNGNDGASVMKMEIINHSAIDYSWKDYPIIIQLSTGETYTNYTPSSNEGKYSCNYIIPANSKLHQFLAFHKQFDYTIIIKAFVIIESAIFDLQSGS